MKLDYMFLKDFLNAIESNSKHSVPYSVIIAKLHTYDEDKFIGHLKLLFDENCIESNFKNGGIITDCGPTDILCKDAECRLTSRGHKFLEVLNNDKVLNKVKPYAIDIAIDIGTQLIMELIKKAN